MGIKLILFTKWKILDSSKFKRSAESKFKVDIHVNKLKFSDSRLNVHVKGENAAYQYILILPQRLKRASYLVLLTLSQRSPAFTCLQYKPFENTAGKGEIVHNEQFLLFPQCFLSVSKTLKLLSANSFNLEDSKICHYGKG